MCAAKIFLVSALILVFALSMSVFGETDYSSYFNNGKQKIHGTATAFSETKSGSLGKLIWKQDFDSAQSAGDYSYDPSYSSPYSASSLGSSEFVYTGDGDFSNPTFSLVQNPVTGSGKSLAMLGTTSYPIYKLTFAGDILSKPGKYTLVINAYKGNENVNATCRFIMNRCYKGAPEMGGISLGSGSFSQTSYSFTVCTKEEFENSGLSETQFTSSKVFAFQYAYLFMSGGNGKTCYFDDLELWYDEYADVTFHTEGPTSEVTEAAGDVVTNTHRSFVPGSTLPSFSVPGSGYSFVGWSETPDGTEVVSTARAGVYDLYAVYEDSGGRDLYGYEDGLSVYEAVMLVSKLNAALCGREAELPAAIGFNTYLDYAEKYGLIPSNGFDRYDRELLRSEMAQMLYAALPDQALNPINTVEGVPDIEEYDDFAGAVLALYRAGIFAGINARGEFNPYDSLIRCDFYTLVSRIAYVGERVDMTLTSNKKAETMLLDKETAKVFEASFISAPASYLASLESFPQSTLAMGKWIWSAMYTRNHMRKDFSVSKTVTGAELEFQCDNQFDLYLNGSLITSDRIGAWYLTGLVDVTDLVVTGTNKIGVRGFLSDNPEKFSAALRGCIHLTYSDGTTQDVDTSTGFKDYGVCGFWQGTEPDGWHTADAAALGSARKVNVNDVHPRQLRRSCYFRKSFESTGTIKKALLYSGSDIIPLE